MNLKTKLKILFSKRSHPASRRVDRFLIAVMERGKAIWYPHHMDMLDVELDGRKFFMDCEPWRPHEAFWRCRQEKEDNYENLVTRLIWDNMRPSRLVLIRFLVWLESQGIDKFGSREDRMNAEIDRILSTTAEDDE